jgi:hypothetical protein
MAKVFDAPEELKLPEMDFNDMDKYDKAKDKYLVDLKKLLKTENPDGKNVGEIIQFPVADGYARYMVANMKPIELVHIALDDAWSFDMESTLTAKQVQLKIDQQKDMDKFFEENKKRQELAKKNLEESK